MVHNFAPDLQKGLISIDENYAFLEMGKNYIPCDNFNG